MVILCRFAVDFVITQRSQVKELIQVTYDFTNPSTKQYNREIGGLLKASKQTGCNNLTLVFLYGQEEDIEVDGKTIHKVLASEWLLRK